jgi:hypothetical protein
MTAAIVTGAVYAASLLDALISSPSERPVESGPRIGFVAPPTDGAFGFGVRVPF